MEMNLGKLIEIEIEIKNPEAKYKARVRWVFEKAELKWGRITESKFGNLWVQPPKFFVKYGWLTPLKILDKYLEDELVKETIIKYEKTLEEKEPEISVEEIEKIMDK